MREESLLCQLKKRFVVITTDSRHGFPVYPNVLATTMLSASDQAWVADFTSIRLRSAFVSLFVHSGCLLAPRTARPSRAVFPETGPVAERAPTLRPEGPEPPRTTEST